MNSTIAELEKKLDAARKAQDVAFRAMQRACRKARTFGAESCLPAVDRYAVATALEHAAYDALRDALRASNG